VRRQVVPESTARTISDMLTAVTGPGGTGVEAAIDGYIVAGKTGTAQKADYVAGGYAEGRWVSSFVGFVPADHPRICIAVVIDEPEIDHYGGTVAGPAFRRIGEATLRHLGVPAHGGGEVLAERAAQARRIAREQRADDDARRVACRQARRAGIMDDPSCRSVHDASEEPVAEVVERAPAEGETRVPDVAGMPARRALVTLASSDLVMDVEGSGLVASQAPSAGEVAPRGAHVHVVLGPRPDAPPVAVPQEDDAGDVLRERRAGVPHVAGGAPR
jgi:cell division protein FtsI (penicillin-binding protein 3)